MIKQMCPLRALWIIMCYLNWVTSYQICNADYHARFTIRALAGSRQIALTLNLFSYKQAFFILITSHKKILMILQKLYKTGYWNYNLINNGYFRIYLNFTCRVLHNRLYRATKKWSAFCLMSLYFLLLGKPIFSLATKFWQWLPNTATGL